MSPTQKSLALLRDLGYHPEVVEKWIEARKIRKDLWGFCDILAIRKVGADLFELGSPILAVQSCSIGDVSKRVKKIKESPLLEYVHAAGIVVIVQGWSPGGGYKRSKLREVIVDD